MTFILLGYLASEMTGKVTYERVYANLTRAIDGDTFDSDIGKVRLLGINTPEKKQPFYKEAKDYLTGYEGKTVEIETRSKDKYDRTLGYVYYSDILVNKGILELGLANLYYYEKDENYESMKKAEEFARNNGMGIWKKSDNESCVELVNLKYVEQERCNNQEQLIINNNCGSMNVSLKDDANHIERFILKQGVYIKNFSCVWNDAGDSLFLRDESGILLFYRY